MKNGLTGRSGPKDSEVARSAIPWQNLAVFASSKKTISHGPLWESQLCRAGLARSNQVVEYTGKLCKKNACTLTVKFGEPTATSPIQITQ